MLKRTNTKKVAKSPVKSQAKKVKKTAAKKIVKKAVKKPAVKKKKPTAATANMESYWKKFREMKEEVKAKLEKLKKDYNKKGAGTDALIEDVNILGLLGGEIDFMIRELEKAEKNPPRASPKPANLTRKKVAKR